MATAAASAGASPADPDCVGDYAAITPSAPPAPLRFGIDPGIAGSAGGLQLPATPVNGPATLAALAGLKPPGGVLVARLNRLFFSDGQAGIDAFAAQVAALDRLGIDSEIQVRYHPPAGENGDLAAWTAYVRHVVDTFGPDPHVVAMTITNEVNLSISPNTSDGSYADAPQALVGGIEAAHDEAARHHFTQLRFGFTYAYRLGNDASFFSGLAAIGGAAFARDVDFVGLDFYPGSIYPPATLPGDTYAHETLQALGTLRDCLMPLAGLGQRVPIWVTENGLPTGLTISPDAQAAALAQIVGTIHSVDRTVNVTDYRYFNLRDTGADALGSLPGVAASFGTDGLLSADYAPKPAYVMYRTLIATDGVKGSGARPRRRVRKGRARSGPPRHRHHAPASVR